MLVTGMHTVRDAFCQGCEARLGWKYGASLLRLSVRVAARSRARLFVERAFEESQRYKVGCYILEKMQVHPEFADAGDC